MSAAPIPKRFSREEYYRLGELGFLDERTELIEGEILEMPPIGPDHASVGTILRRLLESQLSSDWHVRDGVPLDLGERNQPQPDFAVVKGSPKDYMLAHPTEAALVIEVSKSSLDFDRKAKSALYATSGIPEYWIVDLASKCIESYRDLTEGRYSNVVNFNRGETIELAGLPALRLDVNDLF
jgi:Uma2 family endonuclease